MVWGLGFRGLGSLQYSRAGMAQRTPVATRVGVHQMLSNHASNTSCLGRTHEMNPASVREGTRIFLNVQAGICWICMDAAGGKRLSGVLAHTRPSSESILLVGAREFSTKTDYNATLQILQLENFTIHIIYIYTYKLKPTQA